MMPDYNSAKAALLAFSRAGRQELRKSWVDVEALVQSVAADVALAAGPRLRVGIERASGGKCERCWYVLPLGTRPDHPTLCARCAGVVP